MTQSLYLGGILQVRAYRIVQELVAGIVKSFGLSTTTEWFILCHIYYSGPAQASEVANLLGVEAPLITNLTENLETAGLIKKTPHPTDKRAKTLELTAKGGKLAPQIEEALQKNLDKLLKGLKASELNIYTKVLKGIVENSKKK